MPKLAATLGTLMGPIIPNTVFNLNDTVATTMTDEFMGILMIGIVEDDAVGIFRVDNTSLTAISSHTIFTTNPAIPSKYYLFFDSGIFKVTNKVGDGKTLKLTLVGLEQVTS